MSEQRQPIDVAGAADRDLIARLLEGAEEGLATVRSWVRGAAGGYRLRLGGEIEDVEQEIVIELLAALRAGRFEGRSRLSTYVRRMVHHKCLNRMRSRRGRSQVEASEIDLVDPAASPFEVVRRRDELELALRVLAEMPESCRELWSMIHRGLGYDAMSERLGIAAGTLRVRVLRCRERALAARERLSRGNNAATRET